MTKTRIDIDAIEALRSTAESAVASYEEARLAPVNNTVPRAQAFANLVALDAAARGRAHAYIDALFAAAPAMLAELRALREVERAAKEFDGATVETLYDGAVYTRGPFNAASLYGALRAALSKVGAR